MSDQQSKPVEVTLSFSSRLYDLVQFCATMAGKTVEAWIAEKVEGELRTVVDQCEDFVRFTDADIDEALGLTRESFQGDTA